MLLIPGVLAMVFPVLIFGFALYTRSKGYDDAMARFARRMLAEHPTGMMWASIVSIGYLAVIKLVVERRLPRDRVVIGPEGLDVEKWRHHGRRARRYVWFGDLVSVDCPANAQPLPVQRGSVVLVTMGADGAESDPLGGHFRNGDAAMLKGMIEAAREEWRDPRQEWSDRGGKGGGAEGE